MNINQTLVNPNDHNHWLTSALFNINILCHPISDWLTTFFIALSVILIFDYVFCVRLFKLNRGSGGGERWFLIHAVINMWIVWTSLPDFLMLIFDPIGALTTYKISSLYPFAINVCLHFYHSIVFRKDLTPDDWLHHILMVFIGCPLLLIQDPSPTINALHLFLTGLPGGIDYFMLVAVKKSIWMRLQKNA